MNANEARLSVWHQEAVAECERLRAQLEVMTRERDEFRQQALELITERNNEQSDKLEAEAITRKAVKERDEARTHLSNLLARIHRDGGHHEQEVGTAKAVEEADVLVAQLIVDAVQGLAMTRERDEARAEVERLRPHVWTYTDSMREERERIMLDLQTQRDAAERERDEWKKKALRDPQGLSSLTWMDCYTQLSEINQQHLRERDEARAKAEKEGNYAQNAVDKICHYRNLAIILGAKPEQMLGEGDRKLCVDGIDKDDTSGGYHVSVQDVLDDNADTWGAHDKMERERDEARESEARMRAALMRYGAHHSTCILRSQALLAAYPRAQHVCGCGLDSALSAPAPEPSERMMRVAEAVREMCARIIASRNVENWTPEELANEVRALDLRAIVAKVTP